eukprot:jgi/Mesvir1/18737/Mv01248-RA.1
MMQQAPLAASGLVPPMTSPGGPAVTAAGGSLPTLSARSLADTSHAFAARVPRTSLGATPLWHAPSSPGISRMMSSSSAIASSATHPLAILQSARSASLARPLASSAAATAMPHSILSPRRSSHVMASLRYRDALARSSWLGAPVPGHRGGNAPLLQRGVVKGAGGGGGSREREGEARCALGDGSQGGGGSFGNPSPEQSITTATATTGDGIKSEGESPPAPPPQLAAVELCETRSLGMRLSCEDGLAALRQALGQMQVEPPAHASGVLRFEVALPPGSLGALTWLRAQPPSPLLLPRFFFSPRSPRGALLGGATTPQDHDDTAPADGIALDISGGGPVAGVGASLLWTATSEFELGAWRRIRRFLSEGSSRVRAFGCSRFDPGADVAPEWAAFGSYFFLVPAVEVSECADRVLLAATVAWDTGDEAVTSNYEEGRLPGAAASSNKVPAGTGARAGAKGEARAGAGADPLLASGPVQGPPQKSALQGKPVDDQAARGLEQPSGVTAAASAAARTLSVLQQVTPGSGRVPQPRVTGHPVSREHSPGKEQWLQLLGKALARLNERPEGAAGSSESGKNGRVDGRAGPGGRSQGPSRQVNNGKAGRFGSSGPLNGDRGSGDGGMNGRPFSAAGGSSSSPSPGPTPPTKASGAEDDKSGRPGTQGGGDGGKKKMDAGGKAGDGTAGAQNGLDDDEDPHWDLSSLSEDIESFLGKSGAGAEAAVEDLLRKALDMALPMAESQDFTEFLRRYDTGVAGASGMDDSVPGGGLPPPFVSVNDGDDIDPLAAMGDWLKGGKGGADNAPGGPPGGASPGLLPRQDGPGFGGLPGIGRGSGEALKNRQAGGGQGPNANGAADGSQVTNAFNGKQVVQDGDEGDSEGDVAGALSKVVLARRTTLVMSSDVDVLALVALLRERDASPYHFCLQLPSGEAFLGGTPERLYVRVGRVVASEAVAGTRRRGGPGGGDADADDRRLAMELLLSPKEHREFAIVRETVRGVMSEVCDGAVEADVEKALLKQAAVQHLYARFTGTLPDVSRELALLQGLHPTPAVSGHPKEEATRAIHGMEPFDRGMYAGPWGWLGGAGSEFAVAIRSALVHSGTAAAAANSALPASAAASALPDGSVSPATSSAHDKALSQTAALSSSDGAGPSGGRGPTANRHVSLYAGVGVVAGADPGAEWAELDLKIRQYESMLGGIPGGGAAAAATATSGPFSLWTRAANPNMLWASLLIEELTRLGVTYFCIAPGSRSSPLTAAAAAHPRAVCVACLDERSLAFHALGFGRGGGAGGAGGPRNGTGPGGFPPMACVITSSGTAVANLLPAVAEASLDFVPLLVLSADRPPELLDTGANQAMDQGKIFGSYARWHVSVPPPDASVPARFVLSTMDQAVYRAGRAADPGPVHINCQFREPLAPVALPPVRGNPGGAHQHGGGEGGDWRQKAMAGLQAWEAGCMPFTDYSLVAGRGRDVGLGLGTQGTMGGLPMPVVVGPMGGDAMVQNVERSWLGGGSGFGSGDSAGYNSSSGGGQSGYGNGYCYGCDELAPVLAAMRGAQKGMLVVGGGLRRAEDLWAVVALADALGWPIVADVLSGLRVGRPAAGQGPFTGGAGGGGRVRVWGSLAADEGVGSGAANVVHFLDHVLLSPAATAAARPDVILQFGGRITSKRVSALLEHGTARAHIFVAEHASRHDPSHTQSHRVEARASTFCRQLLAEMNARPGPWSPSQGQGQGGAQTAFCRMLLALSDAVGREISATLDETEQLTEPFVARAVATSLAADEGLFLGNSMPIRDMDYYAPTCGPRGPVRWGPPVDLCENNAGSNVRGDDGGSTAATAGAQVRKGPTVQAGMVAAAEAQDGPRAQFPPVASPAVPQGVPVAANRGASGIDGVLSTATGFAVGLARPATLLVGDVSFLHDTNGLLLLRQRNNEAPLTVVVINNNGGGIFSFLPIAGAVPDADFRQFWTTPHDVVIQDLCRAHRVVYYRAQTKSELSEALFQAKRMRQPCVVEVLTDIDTNVEHHKLLQARAKAAADRALASITMYESAAGASSQQEPGAASSRHADDRSGKETSRGGAGASSSAAAAALVASTPNGPLTAPSLPNMGLGTDARGQGADVRGVETATLVGNQGAMAQMEMGNAGEQALTGTAANEADPRPVVRLESARYRPYRVPLAAPPTTTSGCKDSGASGPPKASVREGFLLVLKTDRGAMGIGEVAPLPGLHKESLLDVAEQLELVCGALNRRRGVVVPPYLPLLDGSMAEWMQAELGIEVASLHPSVACGLQLALLTSLSNAVGATLEQLLTAGDGTATRPIRASEATSNNRPTRAGPSSGPRVSPTTGHNTDPSAGVSACADRDREEGVSHGGSSDARFSGIATDNASNGNSRQHHLSHAEKDGPAGWTPLGSAASETSMGAPCSNSISNSNGAILSRNNGGDMVVPVGMAVLQGGSTALQGVVAEHGLSSSSLSASPIAVATSPLVTDTLPSSMSSLSGGLTAMPVAAIREKEGLGHRLHDAPRLASDAALLEMGLSTQSPSPPSPSSTSSSAPTHLSPVNPAQAEAGDRVEASTLSSSSPFPSSFPSSSFPSSIPVMGTTFVAPSAAAGPALGTSSSSAPSSASSASVPLLASAAANAAATAPHSRSSPMPSPPSPVRVCGLVDSCADAPWERAVTEAQSLASLGFCTLKLKVGRRADPLEDAAVVRQVRASVGRHVALRCDANRKWSLAQAVAFGRAVSGCGLQFIEVRVLHKVLSIPWIRLPFGRCQFGEVRAAGCSLLTLGLHAAVGKGEDDGGIVWCMFFSSLLALGGHSLSICFTFISSLV